MLNETFLFRFTHCEILFSAILIVLLWAQKRNSAKVVWISDKTKVHFLLGFRAAAFLLLLLVTLAPFQGETCQISSLSLTLTLNEKKVRRYFFYLSCQTRFSRIKSDDFSASPRNRFSKTAVDCKILSAVSFKTF